MKELSTAKYGSDVCGLDNREFTVFLGDFFKKV